MPFLFTSQPSMKYHSRNVQVSLNDMSFQSLNTLHNSFTTASPPSPQPSLQQQNSHPPFGSSISLTILGRLIGLFFMGLFIYIRKSSSDTTPDFSSHHRNHPTVSDHPSRAAPGSSKGLDPEVINSLPVYSYYHGDAKCLTECAICLGEFEDKETVKIIPYCKHVFHLDCIDTWLKSR
ncbi:hypothetical protein P3X46_009952 [Hevea brasiliensis]|uniref:RING-type E3 ubiquitin transferase n=1 Tax=Hevea brasiliensis TaxID=3981 RepID=A0ABQ9MEV6_HEVBR|nr:hypothetical protein P3X46_009952 [Hevea brasiliensis]